MCVDCRLRRVHIKAIQFAADGAFCVDATQYQISIRYRGPRVALSVTDGAGIRTGGLRADLQQAAPVDPGDGTATGADGGDLDHRRANDQAEVDGRLGAQGAFTVGDQGNIETGAAHVAGDHVWKPSDVRNMGAGDHTGGWAGQSGAHR